MRKRLLAGVSAFYLTRHPMDESGDDESPFVGSMAKEDDNEQLTHTPMDGGGGLESHLWVGWARLVALPQAY